MSARWTPKTSRRWRSFATSDRGVATHRVCMGMGVPLAEYQRTVGPLNRFFHETAEQVHLTRTGVLPLDEDGSDGPRTHGDGTGPTVEPKTHGRGE